MLYDPGLCQPDIKRSERLCQICKMDSRIPFQNKHSIVCLSVPLFYEGRRRAARSSTQCNRYTQFFGYFVIDLVEFCQIQEVAIKIEHYIHARRKQVNIGIRGEGEG